MTKEDVIIIKNLQDGNIYTDEDISNLVELSIDDVKKATKYQVNKDELVIDGSGVIYIMDIKYDTIVDGEGFRNTVYCAKCNFKCPECHNPQSHDIHNGKPITINNLCDLLLENGNDITFSGGECTLQCKAFIKLAKMLKEKDRNIWLYTGNIFENLLKDKCYYELLQYIDVLIDGRFDINKKKLGLVFKGSTNQRIIDVKKSIENRRVINYYEQDD